MPNINIDDAYILNETGEQVDKVTGLFTKDEGTTEEEKSFAQLNIGASGGSGGGRNLFDNPWFTINQRGQSSYGAGNSVDRWIVTSNASINVLSDGVELTTTANRWGMEQRCVKNLIPHGSTVTFSALIDDGEIVQGSFVWNGSNVNLYPNGSAVGLEINTAPTAYDRWYVCNAVASTHTIHAVKIEIGSVSTLANDAPPRTQDELVVCRYRYLPISLNVYSIGGFGFMSSQTEAEIVIPLSSPFALDGNTPTISITNSGNLKIRDASGTNAVTPSSWRINKRTSTFILIGFTIAAGYYSTNTFVYLGTTGDATIAISADL